MGAAKKINEQLITRIHHLSETNQQVVLRIIETLEKAEKKSHKYEFTEEEYDEFDKRWADYKNGKSKMYSIAESKADAFKTLKNVKKK